MNIDGFLIWLLDTVQSVDPVVRTLLTGVAMFCETSILIGLIIPGDTIVLVASTAVSSPAQYVALIVAVVVGSLAGESVGFALGRWFGPRIRGSKLGARTTLSEEARPTPSTKSATRWLRSATQATCAPSGPNTAGKTRSKRRCRRLPSR